MSSKMASRVWDDLHLGNEPQDEQLSEALEIQEHVQKSFTKAKIKEWFSKGRTSFEFAETCSGVPPSLELWNSNELKLAVLQREDLQRGRWLREGSEYF